jgi:tRNA(Arg) A34 adenosine deaminase TadA
MTDNNTKEDHKFMLKAIEFAQKGMDNNEGGPFGAIIVKDGKIVGKGNNKVTSTNDPTAHAEIVAIRDACKNLGTFQLDDCVIYTSCEPCPMCLGAIYWARPKRIVFACDKKDAAAIGFDDDFIYKEIELPITKRSIPTNQLLRNEGVKVFNAWDEKTDKDAY